MKEKDIKVLWGRAAGRCSICRRKLTQDKERASEAFPLGEHAHIVGDKVGSARYDEALTDDERDGYTNRILLCPNDHTTIDKNEDDWSVARLHMAKADHELWIETTLTTTKTVREEADALIYSSLVDALTTDLQLPRFLSWASSILEPYWRWDGEIYEGVTAVRQRVFTTDWPGTSPALEVAIDRASYELQEANAIFTQYSGMDGEDIIARRWYKATIHPQNVYRQLESDFWLWSDTLEQRVFEAMKALNWMRETWRADFNPMWLAAEGWFTVQLHPDSSMRYSLVSPRYTEEEKAELLAKGVGQGDIRRPVVERRKD